jgi:ribosomal protein L5
MKNAFSLQLIDYMAMILKKEDSKMENFQVKYLSFSNTGAISVGLCEILDFHFCVDEVF